MSAAKIATARAASGAVVTSSSRSQVAMRTHSPKSTSRSFSTSSGKRASTRAKRSRSMTGLVRWLVPMTSSAIPAPASLAPGMTPPSLAEGGKAILERGERHLDLLAGVEIAHGGGSARKLVLTQDHRGARADLVGPLHAPRDVARISQIDGKAGAAQLVGRLEGSGFARLANGNDGNWTRRRGRRLDQERETLDPGGPADSGGVGSAHQRHEAVVAAAAEHRALRPQIRGHELERGMAI